MNVLELKKVSKSYKKNINVLSNLSFFVSPGEVYGMIGPNGSGKTTAINIITNLLNPSEGKVSIGGYPPSNTQAKRTFGYVPDELLLPNTLTGEEYLSFVSQIYGVKKKKAVGRLAEILQLEDAMKSLIGEYSHGMKKKLQLISALLTNPKILIMDEPFRGLDPEAIIFFKKIINNRKNAGLSVLITTHDLLSAQTICDRVGILSKGKLATEGSVDELLKEYQTSSLENVFMEASGLMERGKKIEKIIDGL